MKVPGDPGLQWDGVKSFSDLRPSNRRKKKEAPDKDVTGWVKGKSVIAGAFQSFILSRQNTAIGGTHLELVKLGPATAEVFDLAKVPDVKRMTKLMHAAFYDEQVNPPKFITVREKVVVGSRWLVYLEWSDVFYRQLKP